MVRIGRMTTTILESIVATKRQEMADRRSQVSENELRAMILDAPVPRDFFAPLASPGPIRLIAEVKKASPSVGIIRDDFDPVSIAHTYERHGASCISVLTDEQYFQGKLQYLVDVRAAVGIPVLRKDFIIDTYQLLEARAAGADAVLLIAECLDDCNLRKLYGETIELGMVPLIELYEPENLSRVMETGTNLIGINNRNLHTFEVDLSHTLRMRRQIPDHSIVVGESGIKNRKDVELLEAGGVDAMLVGETLMREREIGPAVDRLLNR